MTYLYTFYLKMCMINRSIYTNIFDSLKKLCKSDIVLRIFIFYIYLDITYLLFT